MWGDGDLKYFVGVRGNTFVRIGGDVGEVTGAFFSASHEGMGGVVERNDLAAGFAGKRLDEPARIPEIRVFASLPEVPANHGIEPTEGINVESGTTEHRGSVEIACPAGGTDCVLNVAANGAIDYWTTGGIPTVTRALASLDVPGSPRLGQSEVIVASGETERHGNVEIACPAGGPDCILRTAGGTIHYWNWTTGGMPTVTPVVESLSGYAITHGIGPIEGLRVNPGSTDRHGNAEIMCPDGGPVCILNVLDNRSVYYWTTGGLPTLTVDPEPWAFAPVPGAPLDPNTVADHIYRKGTGSSIGNRRGESISFWTPTRRPDLHDITLFDWGYWNSPGTSPDILKIQKRKKELDSNDRGSIGGFSVNRTVFGILKYAAFWVTDWGVDQRFPAHNPYGAGILYSNSLDTSGQPDFILEHPDVFRSGATWQGDALGITKESGKFVAGSARLTMHSVTPLYFVGVAGYTGYVMRADVSLGDDELSMSTRGHSQGFSTWIVRNVPGTPLAHQADHFCGAPMCTNAHVNSPGSRDYRPYTGEWYQFSGRLVGPNGEEAVGLFETDRYYGSLGAKRR